MATILDNMHKAIWTGRYNGWDANPHWEVRIVEGDRVGELLWIPNAPINGVCIGADIATRKSW